MRDYYEFYNPVKIIAGKNSIALNLGKELKNLGCNRVLVVSGPIINKLGLTDYVATAINNSGVKVCGYFTNVPNESSFQTIKDICDIYRLNNCDSLVALGGGSVLDTAKAVKLVLSQNSEDIDSLRGYDMVREGIKIPMILLPTTCGTGAEITRVSVITNDKNNSKEEFLSDNLLPDVCVLDPEMIKTLPLKSVVLTSFDSLSHAVEGFCCGQKNPLSDRYSILAISQIFEYLPKVVEDPDNEDYRLKLLEAANFSGISFSNSMVGAVHAIAHTMGSVLKIGHDFAVSKLLPYVLQYNMEKSKKDYERLFYYVVPLEEYKKVVQENRPQIFVEKIKELYDTTAGKIGGIPTLKECGLKEELFDEIAKKSLLDGAILTNPKYMEIQDIKNVLQMALEEKLWKTILIGQK